MSIDLNSISIFILALTAILAANQQHKLGKRIEVLENK